jgi:hypothetical protein
MSVKQISFQLIHIKNPFDPYKDMDRSVEHSIFDITIRELLKRKHGPDFVEFPIATLCIVNGNPMVRAEWDTYIIQDKDIITFATLAGGIETIIIYAIIAVVAVVAVVALMGDPTLPGTVNQADSVYNYSGQKNRTRLNEPIEIHYGKNKIYPSYGALVYTQYEDNDQINFSLYCIGQGRYEIHDVLLEDTPLDDFDDAEYEVTGPGGIVTLFPDNVITSVEVSNIQLYSSSDPEYVSPGWNGPFIINPPGTLCKRIEYDITFPQGLYKNDEGKLKNLTVDFELAYRQIDDSGADVGAWVTTAYSVTRNTNTPQRITYKITVPTAGRYKVRARRTDVKNLKTNYVSQLNWEAVRAFLPNTKDYGEVTMLAVRVKANNNVNNNAQQRVNVIATRKLKEWNKATQTWSGFVTSRSIVWAFADCFLNTEYGAALDDQYIDLDALYDLNEIYQDRDEHFDFTFESSLTVWDIAKTIARAGRGIPMPLGSRVGFIRDYPKLLASGVFNQETIIENSFRIDYKNYQPDETDSIIMVYIDPDTWLEEEVLCFLPGSPHINSERITFAGCKSRAHAYHEGMYIMANRSLVRDTIVFKTGLEGHIPTYGDRIYVYHDIPQVGMGAGFVLGIDGDTLTLSEPVAFSDGPPSSVDYVFIIRSKRGAAIGPFLVHDDAVEGNVIKLTIAPDMDNYEFNNFNEPPIFLFGKSDSVSLDCKVLEVNPSDDDTVEIVCSNYVDDIFLYDETDPSDLDSPTTPPRIPNRPVITTITVSSSPLQESYIIVGWSPALGAVRYRLEYSYDNVNWTHAVTQQTTSFIISINPGTIYLRVAGINAGRGPWKTWDGIVGISKFIPGYPDNLVTTSPTANQRKFTWNASPYATAYKIEIQSIGAGAPCRVEEIYELEYLYKKADYLADGGSNNSWVFRVYGVNSKGSSQFNLTVITPSPAWYP